jgi:hypothetical protein
MFLVHFIVALRVQNNQEDAILSAVQSERKARLYRGKEVTILEDAGYHTRSRVSLRRQGVLLGMCADGGRLGL